MHGSSRIKMSWILPDFFEKSGCMQVTRMNGCVAEMRKLHPQNFHPLRKNLKMISTSVCEMLYRREGLSFSL